MDDAGSGTSNADPVVQWQIRFDPGLSEEQVARIAEFALAEGIVDSEGAAAVRVGQDPRYWFSGVLDRASAARHRDAVQKALDGRPLDEQDSNLVRGCIERFDEWLVSVAYARSEIYDSDSDFFDFD